MAVVIDGTTGIDKVQDGSIQTADLAANAVTAAKIADVVNLGRRNLLYNGAMQVSQRDQESVSGASLYGSCDRWKLSVNSAGTYISSRSTDAPDGFEYSMRVNTSATGSLIANSYSYVSQILEGQDLVHLKKGTSDAKQLTLSFWVKSNLTGTYNVNLRDTDNSRHESHTYTINAADTWEFKTITYSADTAGSTAFNHDNQASLYVNFWLAAGSNFTSGTMATTWTSLSDPNRVSPSHVNHSSSTSNEWRITGVQLEIGDTATPFENRPYVQELSECRRYFYTRGGGANKTICHVYPPSTGEFATDLTFPTQMRISPSLSWRNTNSLTYRYAGNGSASFTSASGSISTGQVTEDGGSMWFAGWSHGQSVPGEIRVTSTANFLDIDAEL